MLVKRMQCMLAACFRYRFEVYLNVDGDSLIILELITVLNYSRKFLFLDFSFEFPRNGGVACQVKEKKGLERK